MNLPTIGTQCASTKYIVEGLQLLLQSYSDKRSDMVGLEECEDELADLGNDIEFVKYLLTSLSKYEAMS